MNIWKTKLSKIFFNQILLSFLGLAIIIGISVPLIKNLLKRYAINQEIAGLESEIKALEGRNVNIKKLIEYFKTDSYVEEQARLNLNLKKEGENVVVIKNNELPAEPLMVNAPTAENFSGKTPSNPRKWLRYFILN